MRDAELVALLRDAKSVIEDVDDHHHPYSHNGYMSRVYAILDRIDAVLNDGPEEPEEVVDPWVQDELDRMDP